MSDIWQDLNPRQRMDLQALYAVDQAEAADRQRAAANGSFSRTPAAQAGMLGRWWKRLRR